MMLKRTKTLPLNPWIVSKTVDLPVFILLPILILIGYAIVSRLVSFETLFIIVSISAVGHHVPGFIRAYTDSVFLKQYRYRLIIIPIVLFVIALWLSFYNLGVLGFLVIIWGVWHGCLQNYGFLRIYDFKSGITSKRWAKFDFWTYITCYFSILFLFGMRQTTLVISFYEYGGFILPYNFFWTFKWILWLSASVLLTIFTVLNIYKWYIGEMISIRKLIFFFSSLAFWYYCMKLTSHIVLGLVFIEIFHDIQYNVFVWYYNKKRVQDGLSQSTIERFLFRKSWVSLFIYIGVITLYGFIGLFNLPKEAKSLDLFFDLNFHWILKTFIISALLHFYIDGFIWKVRSQKIQVDLGLKVDVNLKKSVRHKNFFHNIAWFVVFVMIILMGLNEYRYHQLTIEEKTQKNVKRHISLATLVPKSWLGNFFTASHYEKNGEIQKAILYYERAVEFYPEEVLNYVYLANAYKTSKQYDKAVQIYQKAMILDPSDENLKRQLYYLFIQQQKYDLALQKILYFIQKEPWKAKQWSQAGELYYALGDLKQAKVYLHKAISLKKDNPKPWFILSEISLEENNPKQAKIFLEKARLWESRNNKGI